MPRYHAARCRYWGRRQLSLHSPWPGKFARRWTFVSGGGPLTGLELDHTQSLTMLYYSGYWGASQDCLVPGDAPTGRALAVRTPTLAERRVFRVSALPGDEGPAICRVVPWGLGPGCTEPPTPRCIRRQGRSFGALTIFQQTIVDWEGIVI